MNRYLEMSDYELVDPKDVLIEPVALFESWETVDGIVYHKWRKEGEEDWHWVKTAYKEPPVIFWKHVTLTEYEEFYKTKKDDGNPKGSDWQGMETVDVKTSIPLDDNVIDILTSTPSVYKPIQADDPHNTLGEDILATGTWK